MDWQGLKSIHPRAYACGHCGNRVGSNQGWHTSGHSPTTIALYICSTCSKPTYFEAGRQIPGVQPGSPVEHVPQDVHTLYEEARSAVSAGANTAAVLACRKLLMNVAVAQGADPGKSFVSYVEHLAQAGYIPPNGRHWVDHIRKKGNEATHEIQLMTADDATELVAFSEMLLKFVFEFPSRVPRGAA